MQCVPLIWKGLLANGWKGHPGSVSISLGEQMPIDLAWTMLNMPGRVYNGYGSSEVNYSTFWELSPDRMKVLFMNEIEMFCVIIGVVSSLAYELTPVLFACLHSYDYGLCCFLRTLVVIRRILEFQLVSYHPILKRSLLILQLDSLSNHPRQPHMWMVSCGLEVLLLHKVILANLNSLHQGS